MFAVSWRFVARLGGLAVAIVSSATSVRAADAPTLREASRLPPPFVLPELSHSRAELRMDGFIGRFAPEDPTRDGAVATLVRPGVEANVFVPRQVFVGLTWPFAAALPPDGGLAPDVGGTPSGTRAMLGNVEGHVRAVFQLPMALEIGFSLGVAAPTATFDRGDRPRRSAAEAVSSLDPTNYVHFLPDRIALRPAGDLRILRGPFVLQGRHGIDIVIDDRGLDPVKVAGRLLAHVGVLVRPELELSFEATQVYFFSSEEKTSSPPTPETAFDERYRVSDGHRTAVTVGPGMRLSFHDLDVGAAVVTNLSDPLSPAADGFVGLRVSLVGHAGRPLR